MADVHEIRGASVTARGSAPVHRDSPFRWLTHPRRDEFTPLRNEERTVPSCGQAPRCAASRQDRRSSPLHPPPAPPDGQQHSCHPPGRVHPRGAPRRPVSAKKCRASGQESAYCTPARTSTPCVWQCEPVHLSLSLPFFPPKPVSLRVNPWVLRGIRRIWWLRRSVDRFVFSSLHP